MNHLDIHAEGGYSQRARDLLHLHQTQCEHGSNHPEDHSLAVSILKLLTVISAVFFTIFALTSLPPELAFISVTLILAGTAAIVVGSEKIIRVFPRGLWIWTGHSNYHHHVPVYAPRNDGFFARWTPISWRSSSPPSTERYDLFSRANPRMPTHLGSGHHRDTSTTSGGHTGLGGGYTRTPYAGGTPNVGVGGGHDRFTTTVPSTGQVIPGSRAPKS